jgi:hypothetical protein
MNVTLNVTLANTGSSTRENMTRQRLGSRPKGGALGGVHRCGLNVTLCRGRRVDMEKAPPG